MQLLPKRKKHDPVAHRVTLTAAKAALTVLKDEAMVVVKCAKAGAEVVAVDAAMDATALIAPSRDHAIALKLTTKRCKTLQWELQLQDPLMNSKLRSDKSDLAAVNATEAANGATDPNAALATTHAVTTAQLKMLKQQLLLQRVIPHQSTQSRPRPWLKCHNKLKTASEKNAHATGMGVNADHAVSVLSGRLVTARISMRLPRDLCKMICPSSLSKSLPLLFL